MKISWNKKTFWILLVLIFSIGFANNSTIILLDLSVFQIVITTTISCIIGVAIILILKKHGYLTTKIKNDGNRLT
jgi:hypothetical protein